MITTVTLNPMLDKTVVVDALRRAAVTRASKVSLVVGGKGVNVSRQLHALGEPTVATGFVGGEIGSILERLLDEEEIGRQFVRVGTMTREGVTYLESDGTSTSVFEPPHTVTPGEVSRLLETCRTLASRSDWLVCGGSSPSASADDAFRMIIADCRACGVPVVLDSYGNALVRGVEAGPNIIKPNREEFEQTFGRKLTSDRDMAQAACEMVSRGLQYCLITDGPRPFAGAGREGVWMVTPPQIGIVNPTGSGDSMIAGLLYGLRQGWPFAECLAFGSAAGAANARVWEVANSSREEIVALLPRVSVLRVSS